MKWICRITWFPDERGQNDARYRTEAETINEAVTAIVEHMASEGELGSTPEMTIEICRAK